jgi:hypothetical protein
MPFQRAAGRATLLREDLREIHLPVQIFFWRAQSGEHGYYLTDGDSRPLWHGSSHQSKCMYICLELMCADGETRELSQLDLLSKCRDCVHTRLVGS